MCLLKTEPSCKINREVKVDNLKEKPKHKITREDIASLLKSIDKPGRKKREKIEAVKALGLSNFQNIDVINTIREYPEF